MRLRLAAVLVFALVVMTVGVALGLAVGIPQRDAQVVSYPAACVPVDDALAQRSQSVVPFGQAPCDYYRRCVC